MGERIRRRKSLWDSKEVTQQPAPITEKNASRGEESFSSLHRHDPKWSDSEINNTGKSKDSSWSSLEPSQGNSGRNNERRKFDGVPHSRRAWEGDNSDGWGQKNHSHSPENNWSQSNRYKRSRSQSRSQCLSKERGRGRGRSRSRSRSRSRGRSRSRDWNRDCSSRSRSPLPERRQKSHGWTDRRDGAGISSQLCRDFAVGKCRRGSQCRFLHEDNLNHRGGVRLEKDQSESRNRHDGGTNHFDGEKDAPLRNSGDSATLCQGFLEGRCRRGSSCRYPHHDAFGDSSKRSNRSPYVDQDDMQQPHKNSNIACKYFTMGKCHRDDCRFSHDESTHNSFEGKLQDDSWPHDFDGPNKPWNGRKWGESTAVSDVAMSTGWGSVGEGTFNNATNARNFSDGRWGSTVDDNNQQWNDPKWGEPTGALEITNSNAGTLGNVENMTLAHSVNAEKFADDHLAHNVDSQTRTWGSQAVKDKAAEGNETMSSGTNILNAGEKDAATSFDRDPMLFPTALESHSLNGMSRHALQENVVQAVSTQQLISRDLHTDISENSQFEQETGVKENVVALMDNANSDNALGCYVNGGPIFNPRLDFHQNVDKPPSSNGINQNQHVIAVNLSNECKIDSTRPVQQNLSPLYLHSQVQTHNAQFGKKLDVPPLQFPLVNSGIPLNVVNKEQDVLLSKLPPSLTHILDAEQIPQLYAVLNPLNSTGAMPSFPHSTGLAPMASMDAQTDPAILQGQYISMRNVIESNKTVKSDQIPGDLFNSVEQKHSSPLSTIQPDSSKLQKNVGTEDENHRSPKLKEQQPFPNSVAEGNSKSVVVTCKEEQENVSAGILNAAAKAKDANNDRDEKVIRLFKVALVEFVKEILKPKWKEGQMSREVHKTIVKKVVDKVTSTLQGDSIPNTQHKVDQYLSYSKPKITKLAEAYMERLLKSS